MNIARKSWGMVGVETQNLASVLLVLTLVSTAPAKYSGGSGVPQDPYQIATAADLIALGEDPNDYDKHFLLTADIDLDPNLPGGRVFGRAVIAPANIGLRLDRAFVGTPFVGVFDGDGHSISNLTMAGDDCLGLFGRLAAGAEVRDLGMHDVAITGAGDCVGGLVGSCDDAVVTDCHSTGTVNGSGYFVGGLAGATYYNGRVTRCYSIASVRGLSDAGGLVGTNGGGVTSSYSSGIVSGQEEIGGLVGSNGQITVDGWSGDVANCYSTAKVDGDTYVGGLVGRNWEGSVAQCYSAGVVSGNTYIGGLMGQNLPGYGNVSACFWDTQASGQTSSSGGMGKTTTEMQTAKTFLDAGWDFKDVWVIWDRYDYPRLRWEPGAGLVFAKVAGGTFEMGDHDGVGRDDERPVHTVTLDGFQMSKYETTNAQYIQYLNEAMAEGLIQVVGGRVYASSDANLAEPYCDTYSSWSWSQIEYSQGRFTVRRRDNVDMSDHPVVFVSWYGAKAFCDYYGYRLPTEAQWEYAARGGYHDPYYQYPWGDNTVDCSKANYGTDTGPCNPLNLTDTPYTSPVGYYGPQGTYGLCDMSGNVWEWCQDWYDKDYYHVSPASNPAGPNEGWSHVLRGGSWLHIDYYCRVSARLGDLYYTEGRAIYVSGLGFRVCR